MNSDEDDIKPIHCFCQGMCPNGREYGTCQTKPGGKCFTSVELELGDDGKNHPILSYGCLPPNEMALFQCRATLIASREGKNIQCCEEYDFCNKHLLPVVEKVDDQVDYFHHLTVKVLLASIATCLALFFFGLLLVYLKVKREESNDIDEDKEEEFEVVSCGEDSGIKIGVDLSESQAGTSGSKVDLVQRTILKQISFQLMVGTGRWTEIWRAKWRGEKVAVKIYSKAQENLWLREIEIYQCPLIRHEHILGYIAADVKGSGPTSTLYIITEYHDYGCLRDYLKNHALTPLEAFHMAKGLSSGLNHLHTEIIGSSRKPCITHNNISSKNILVKRDNHLCFADFGSSTRYFSCTNKLSFPEGLHPEANYISPEFLSDEELPQGIEPYKMADVYSFSLILWELLTRCSGVPYSSPYLWELGGREMSRKTMKELVVVDKKRPEVRDDWEEDPLLKMMTKIMVECWSATPSVRLTSLRIKKTFFKVEV